MLFNLFAITAWAFTWDSGIPLHTALRTRLSRYMTYPGLRQTWTMFAPNPMRWNVYVEAEITFADGSRTTWAVPRMERLGHFERHQKERYRKWSTERLGVDQPNPVLTRAAAQYVARQVEARPENPPRRVELVRYFSPIPAPKTRRLPRYPDAAGTWKRETIFACELDDAGEITKVVETGADVAGPETRAGVNAQRGEAR